MELGLILFYLLRVFYGGWTRDKYVAGVVLLLFHSIRFVFSYHHLAANQPVSYRHLETLD